MIWAHVEASEVFGLVDGWGKARGHCGRPQRKSADREAGLDNLLQDIEPRGSINIYFLEGSWKKQGALQIVRLLS